MDEYSGLLLAACAAVYVILHIAGRVEQRDFKAEPQTKADSPQAMSRQGEEHP